MRLIPALSLITLSVAAAAGCGSSDDAEDPSPVGRTFVSVQVEGDPIPGGGPLVVGFGDSGQISVFAGCNRGTGAAELVDGVIDTTLATTMMACPPPLDGADAWVSQLFDGLPSWTLSGDTLTLATDSVTVTLRDKEIVEPDRPLTDTDWLVRSTISTQAVSTSVALEQAAPTLTIAGDGAVTGWTGCNEFTGRAQLSEDRRVVDFEPLAVTKRACPPGLDEVQTSVLRVLDGRVQVAIDADELRLTRDDGYGLVLNAR